jgi:nucleoside-diphosphate kinase
MERTLIILKPDAVQRGLMGAILSRFESKGLKVVAARFQRLPESLLAKHYEAHKARPFYPGLVRFMSESPVMVLVLEGAGAIAVCRKMMGATFGRDAEPGTIRGDFGVSRSYNLIHGSDSPEAAEREISLFFEADEVVEWQPAGHKWVYDAEDLA